MKLLYRAVWLAMLVLLLPTLVFYTMDISIADTLMFYSTDLGLEVNTNLPHVKPPSVSRAVPYSYKIRNITLLPEQRPEVPHTTFKTFPEALAARASPSKQIILSLMDMATYPMAMNFWEASLLPYDIENYLFVSSNRKACLLMVEQGLPCFLYMEDRDGDRMSIYMSVDFKRKMNIRTYMILEALHLGYNVLHTDLDVVWFSNPLDDIDCDRKCDIAALWDCGPMNAGFVYVRPTPKGIDVYNHMNKTATTTNLDDQTAFNNALRHYEDKGLALVQLSGDKYQCGRRHWEEEQRTFAGDNPCQSCVVAHNNWIVSLEAKTYRFKEMHYWLYDENQYYSSTERKYLTYTNVYDADVGKTKPLELAALKSALSIGTLLNRTVILPTFHCGTKNTAKRLCDVINHILIRHLDKEFPGKYREHTFLAHPKVPDRTKHSKSGMFLIQSNLQRDLLGALSRRNINRFTPRNTATGATGREIISKFGGIQETILNFHSLYGAVNYNSDAILGTDFQQKLKKAIVDGKYRQF